MLVPASEGAWAVFSQFYQSLVGKYSVEEESAHRHHETA